MTTMFNNTFVGRFLNWKQGDEEEIWRNKAFEVLMKKASRQNQTENVHLFMRLKKEETPCVTLDRSKDGRLQVMHRKMLPHVLYCRIFRWPDLQSQHELKSVPSCRWPAHIRELSEICVNPYHYSRVDHSTYPPVVCPRNNEFTNASPPPCSPMSYDSNYSSQQQSPPYPSRPNPQTSPYQLNFASDPYNFFGSQNSNQPLGLTTYHANQPSNGGYGGTNGQMEPMPNEENMQPTKSGSRVHSSPLPAYSVYDQGSIPMDCGDYTQRAIDKDAWCRIDYLELNQKVGVFSSSEPSITVDGFTNPEARGRFSLGTLSNPTRNKGIETVRNWIGKGILLQNDNGQIFVTNMSAHSIFFNSKNCNIENQLTQYCVVKIESGKRQKIFDQKIFDDLLHEAMASTDGKSFERLSSLVEHCIIKLSFVKGWGSIYKRQDASSTPCWIEIHLLKCYALIDQYLPSVKPTTQITSTS